MAETEPLLIDDFSQTDGRSQLGPQWQGFSDRVMGGLSEMEAGYRVDEPGPRLVLSGQVRLENNGGFIQMRLPLSGRGTGFDASAWRGVQLTVRGKPGPYYVHLRSRDTGRPWQYYRARIEVNPEWRTQVLAFDQFEPQALRRALDTSALTSLGIVAYGEAFDAEIEVARIEFIPNP